MASQFNYGGIGSHLHGHEPFWTIGSINSTTSFLQRKTVQEIIKFCSQVNFTKPCLGTLILYQIYNAGIDMFIGTIFS